MSTVRFFATSSDLLRALLRLEKVRDVHYFRAGIFETNEPTAFASAADIPNLGISENGAFGLGPRYLLSEGKAQPLPRQIHRQDGNLWYAFDQLVNPDSAVLSIGGTFGAKALIRSEITATGLTAPSKSLVDAARRAVSKDFTRVRAFWVGPEALKLLSCGWRLTTNAAGSPEYDLTLQD